MRKNLKWLICLILSVVAIASVLFVPNKGVNADTTSHNVYFNYKTNYGMISDYLDDSIKGEYNDIISVSVSHGETVTQPKLSNNMSQYYRVTWKILSVDEYVAFNFNTPITKDITLVAYWMPVNYNIYFTYPSGEDSEITNCKYSQTYNYESEQLELYRPQRPNYVFVNWYTDSSLTKVYLFTPAHSSGNIILYPKWRAVDYIITYHTEGDNLYNITTYNINTADFVLRAPTRAGYSFMGWYYDEDFTYECTKITNQMTGDIDLYAKWEAIMYRVTYVMPNGTTETVFCKYGETAQLPNVDKTIFEVIKTSGSRQNITEDTILVVMKVSIWYVYVIALIVILAIIGVIIYIYFKRTKTIKKLRYMYQSNYKK